MKVLACATLAIFLTVTSQSRAHAATVFTGKLWILPGMVSAQFPVPATPPDATFLTEHIALFSSAPGPALADSGAFDNTIGTFLTSANPIANLKFSGYSNPAIGAPVGPTTPTVNSTADNCGTYSTYVEFTGPTRLVHNEFMYLGVDDAVSMTIDGTVVISGTWDGFTYYQFPGTTGNHTIDLVYSNNCGGGWLAFSPRM